MVAAHRRGEKLLLTRMMIVAAGMSSLIVGLSMAAELDDGQKTELKPVLSRLSEVCGGDLAQLSSNDLKQLSRFYTEFNFTPQWTSAEQREQLQAQIQQLRFDGLNPKQYPLAANHNAFDAESCTDIQLSYSYLSALQALRQGVLDPQQVEPYWFDKNTQGFNWQADTVALAAQYIAQPEQAFSAVRPKLITYQQLRNALQQRLERGQQSWVEVPAGAKSLKPNARDDERTPILRARLTELNYLPEVSAVNILPGAAGLAEITTVAESALIAEHLVANQAAARTEELHGLSAPIVEPENIYDAELVEAVKAFQRDHRLADDGIVGPATLKQINISPEQRNRQIAINLERMRWVNNLMEPTLLLTDIAGAQLNYFYQGEHVWQSRGQVGSAARKTPLMKSRITHLTLNPTWTVPPTIYRRDKLPAIQRDIGYLERSRMTVLDMQGNRLDPYEVDWSNPGPIMLRQAAGPRNALGQVAIRFPNPFMVYLHDTPSQALFDRANRSVSSGCVRVENIQHLIDWLFKDAGSALQNKVKQVQQSGRTQNVSLAQPIPVLLAYWTAAVEEDGRLQFRSDIYNYDSDLINAWRKAVEL